VIPLAHVGAVPVEELLALAPTVWVAIGARLSARRRGQRYGSRSEGTG
jgi:hypothetical protein